MAGHLSIFDSAFGPGNTLLDRLLARNTTPGILPGLENPVGPPQSAATASSTVIAPSPRVAPIVPPTAPEGVFGKIDSFLGGKGGNFLLNLLAQQGSSLLPTGGPLGAIGRAGLATNKQQQQKQLLDQNQQFREAQKRLIEAQTGLAKAKTGSEGVPGAAEPLTQIAKLGADFRAGLIPKEIHDAGVNKILAQASQQGFENTQKLRGEFSKDTQDIQKSLQSLAAAGALIQTAGNPISQLAAFISTIKSIDNSTVREGELRAFENVQGIQRQLENQLAKAKGEGFSPQLRRDIAATINALQSPLNELLDSKRKFFSSEATKNRLDPESITGVPFSVIGDISIDGAASTDKVNPVLPGEESEQEI